jgi:hypothetical protein
MGCAWSFIDFKPAIAGGKAGTVALGFWAELLFTNKALAATKPAWRRARRLGMVDRDYRTQTLSPWGIPAKGVLDAASAIL